MEVKISIITINLNNKKGLKQTIQSVVNQNCSNIEYIIVDGDSVDGSKDLLNNHKIHKAISEKDNGIYNAMNKGISLATGDYCLFLNSGDILFSDKVIESIRKYIKETKSSQDIIYGNIMFSTFLRKYPTHLTLDFLLCDSLPHPATFFKRTIFGKDDLGKYIENFQIVSDWVFYIKAYLSQYKFSYIDMVISIFDTTGISSINKKLEQEERQQVLNNIYPNFISDIKNFRELYAFRYSRSHRYLDKIKLFISKLDLKRKQ